MDELIAFLRCKTSLGRFSAPEIRELIARMEEDGWEIVRKAEIVEPPAPIESPYMAELANPFVPEPVEPEPPVISL